MWAGGTPDAEDGIFNITNGDQFRWQYIWPRIARMFDMETAEPVPMPLVSYMADKTELWQAIVEKHGLRDTPYDTLVSWNFADFIFNSGFDNVSSTIRARKAGFAECIDTEDMFRAFFEDLRMRKVIP